MSTLGAFKNSSKQIQMKVVQEQISVCDGDLQHVYLFICFIHWISA